MEIQAKLPSRVVNAPGLTWLALLVVLGLMALAPSAHAELSSNDVIDLVLRKYQAAAAGWETAILNEARWLFWKIALLSLVVLISFALLTRPEGVIAEIARWVLFTGVFYWALDQGPAFARGIINSMRTLGSTATGTGKELYPSDIMDIGFKLWGC
jgi:P-type conjugative transfer protein TrbL